MLKGKNQIVAQCATEYRRQFGRYTISVVTITEMVKGFQKLGHADRVESLLTAISTEEVLPLELEAALFAGRILGELERIGQSIGRADPLIAGIALARDLTLVTGNTRHFDRIIDLGFSLKLEDWRQ